MGLTGIVSSNSTIHLSLSLTSLSLSVNSGGTGCQASLQSLAQEVNQPKSSRPNTTRGLLSVKVCGSCVLRGKALFSFSSVKKKKNDLVIDVDL